MHPWILVVHNLVRWAVLFAGAYSLLRGATGLLAKGVWLPSDARAARIFPIILDLQVVVGLLLWLTSAHGTNTPLPEHAVVAIAALVLAHVGSISARRSKNAKSRFQSIVVFHGLALLLIAARLPWHAPLLPRLP